MKNNSTKIKIVTAILTFLAVLISFATINGVLNPISAVLGAVATPIQIGINSVSDTFGNVWGFFTRYDDVLQENEQLKDKIAQLEKLERDYNRAIDENQDLRVLARLSITNPTYEYEFAGVTAIDNGEYSKIITIDKGAVNGIELYDCVIIREGLVGYVSKVGPNFSEVTSVLDATMQVGAVVSDSQEIGVAGGNIEFSLENKLKLSYLANDTQTKEKDIVETSGYGDIYPRGIVIGYVDSVEIESHGLSTYATLTPAADITKLKKVFVIKEFTK